MSEKIVLYYAPRTRATRPRWVLEELELPYELHRIDVMKREHKSSEYLQVHPLGLVPTLKVGRKTMWESGAMVQYFADRHPEKKLAPSPTSEERLPYTQWFFYFQNNVEPHAFNIFRHTLFLPENQRMFSEVKKSQEALYKSLQPVEALLRKQEYLLNKFSAVDIFAGSMVIWCQAMKQLADFPGLSAYADRLKERPAYQRATKD